MKDETDMDMSMSGNGEVLENKPGMEPSQDKARKHEKPLAIRGTLDDVLRAAMTAKTKDQQVKANRP